MAAAASDSPERRRLPTSWPVITWEEGGQSRSARWRAESGLSPPARVVIADDQMTADDAYRLACEGTALLWRGDFQNARQLLQAITRRAAMRPKRKTRKGSPPVELSAAFHLHRQAQAQRARILAMLVLPFEASHAIPLRRAPDVRQACLEAYGRAGEPYVTPLRELLGIIGAYEWRRKGVEIPALGARIHPHYGVFAPIRSEYVDLVAAEPLPAPVPPLAIDVGSGTGVLAAVLARRGIARVIATEIDPRALACARENIERLHLSQAVNVVYANLFPAEKARLIVCNPPWLPARPSSSLEHAIYDPGSQMLRAFLRGLREHLAEDGEGWLLLSDLAERLSLRTRAELLAMISEGGLVVVGRSDTRPVHPRAADASDPLHAARSAEITSLWRLAAA